MTTASDTRTDAPASGITDEMVAQKFQPALFESGADAGSREAVIRNVAAVLAIARPLIVAECAAVARKIDADFCATADHFERRDGGVSGPVTHLRLRAQGAKAAADAILALTQGERT